MRRIMRKVDCKRIDDELDNALVELKEVINANKK